MKLWDWKTGEKYEWKSFEHETLTEEERAALQGKFSQEEKARQAAKEATQERVSRDCEHRWEADFGSDGQSAYLERKHLPGNLYGARLTGPLNALITGVPCRDIEGRLWGIQEIDAVKVEGKRDKNFVAGMRIRGCFHTIGSIDPQGKIYVCEGFATAASVHLATGVPTVCAFNAGNLESVCLGFRVKFPQIEIVVAGDSDRFTKRADGTPFNPGALAAQQAARECRGQSIFPVFATLEGTDWNDLHVQEGIQRVKEQLEKPTESASGKSETDPGAEYVLALGYAGDNYYFTSSSNPQINRFTDLSETDCYKLMPRDYWEREYGEFYSQTVGKKEVQKFHLPWNEVKSSLMAEAREAGYFERHRIRGSGVWVDEGRTVIHLGDRLSIDGHTQPLRQPHSQAIYEYGRRLAAPHPEPLTVAELEPFRKLLTCLNYARPEQAYFLGGWLALSNICGVLPWRPHIWITGEQGSGKSTAIDWVLKPLTSAFAHLHVQGATTEAGIRQSLRSNAVPILFDEFESASSRAAGRVEQVIEFFRQGSCDSGGSITKGSASGEATDYHARFCGAVASIGTNLVTGADKSRFTLIELKKVMGNTGQWEEFQRNVAVLTPEYCQRFFSRKIKLIPLLLKNQKKLQAAFATKHSQRFGQQYGTLLAGWFACCSDSEISQGEAEELAGRVHLDQEISSNQTPDQEECLQHLLHSQTRIEDSTTSIAQLFKVEEAQRLDWQVLGSKHWREDAVWKVLKPKLGSVGVIPNVTEQHGPGFVVLTVHPELRRLFKDSRWGSNWAQNLARLKGSIPNYKVKDCSSKGVRGTWLPAHFVLGEIYLVETKM